ncbi:MAG: chemotaxis protein CheW [Luteitalea sp.]|nr:chemotaxis protein CheW [Luteitalea sp.]
MEKRHELSLLCRVGELLCALPLEHVEETMRPLPVAAIAGVPSFVRGLAVLRGAPVPVVDTASLLTGHASHPGRFVTVKTGNRRVALIVDTVVGVVEIPGDSIDALPRLLQDARLDAISAAGAVDADLLLVLRSSRLVSEEAWALLDPDCALA